MQVIGSGFGRTGTLSMQAALEQLGFGPCYHMLELVKRPAHIKAWHEVAATGETDWTTLFDGYESAVDFPACCVYRELMIAFPDAKVIHTVRDREKWYDSVRDTIYQAKNLYPAWLRLVARPIARLDRINHHFIYDGAFQGSFDDRDRALDIFDEWTESVREHVPGDRLLIFDVARGWEPLCGFLGVPVPDQPFPHLNDKETLQRSMRRGRLAFRLAPLVLGAVIAAILYLALR